MFTSLNWIIEGQSMPQHSSRSSDELARQILQVVALIPYGKVASYGQIAKMAGLPKHARLVGYILKHLETDAEIPWYRVINSQGKISLSKLNDRGDKIQCLKLLEEGVMVIGDKINLKQYQWINE